eukprot:gene5580-6269_t
MFSSKEYIESKDSKLQILGNLANFAYDPINYEYLRDLNVIDLFLDMFTEEDERLIEFGVGGICNCCLDENNQKIIIENGGVDLVTGCLSSSNEETVLNAMTSLIFLITPETKSSIITPAVVECMRKFSKSSNNRIKNLACIFLEDYCDISSAVVTASTSTSHPPPKNSS